MPSLTVDTMGRRRKHATGSSKKSHAAFVKLPHRHHLSIDLSPGFVGTLVRPPLGGWRWPRRRRS
jgi:hypothetical protein